MFEKRGLSNNLFPEASTKKVICKFKMTVIGIRKDFNDASFILIRKLIFFF
jgi:hypothetical protein